MEHGNCAYFLFRFAIARWKRYQQLDGGTMLNQAIPLGLVYYQRPQATISRAVLTNRLVKVGLVWK
jgi:hypothetical protein